MTFTFLLLLLILVWVYILYRNNQVYYFTKYFNNLIYLNNMIQINKGNGIVFSYKLVPAYSEMVFSVMPLHTFLKKPENFKQYRDLSAEEIGSLKHEYHGAVVNDNIDECVLYLSKYEHTKKV